MEKQLFKNKRRMLCFAVFAVALVLALVTVLCWRIFAYVPTRSTGPENTEFPFSLPDYTAYYSDNYLRYDDLSPEIVKKYIKKLEREGFTYCDSTYWQLLYREDALIILSDNTDPRQEFILDKRGSLSMEYYLQTPPPEGFYTGNTAFAEIMSDRANVTYVDCTPDGMYEATGMRVAVVARFEELPSYTQYSFSAYLVGEEGAAEFPVYYYDESRFVWADIDGDRENEVVMGGRAHDLNRPSAQVYVYGVEDGSPVLEAEFFSLTSGGSPEMAVENGEIYLIHIQQIGWKGEEPVYATNRIKLEVRDGVFYNPEYIIEGDLILPEYEWQSE